MSSLFDTLVKSLNDKDEDEILRISKLLILEPDLIRVMPDWIKIKLLRVMRALYFVEPCHDLISYFIPPGDNVMRGEFREETEMIDYYSVDAMRDRISKVDQFNSDAIRLNYSEIIAMVIEALDKSRPFSYIRLGDGEGNVLGLTQNKYPNANRVWAKKICDLQFGQDVLSHDQILEVAKFVSRSVSSCDILGIMRPERLKEIYFNKELPYDRQLSGNFYNYEFLVESGLLGERNFRYADSSINYDPYFENRLFDLADKADKIGILGPHPEAVDFFNKMGLDVFKFIRIPGEKKYFPSSDQHYPDGFRIACDEIHKYDLSGVLFYVGGGLLGKYYCSEIKKMGGVALDIGSSMDRISGFRNTRGV